MPHSTRASWLQRLRRRLRRGRAVPHPPPPPALTPRHEALAVGLGCDPR